jgi:predicted nucleic acid-binding protein
MRAFIDANLLIYINSMEDSDAKRVYVGFMGDLLKGDRCYVDALVLDEVLYISKRKYDVSYEVTCDFLDGQVIPYVDVLPITVEEYRAAVELLKSYPLKPSDAIHLAVMKTGGIDLIASEDDDFDTVDGIKRIWIQGSD